MSDDNMEIEPCVEPAAGSFCITENVFDEFQSSSMYQEDEFITLRDILPPQPEVPNLARSLDDFSDENEVTVDSSGIEEIRSIEDSHKQNETIHENQNQKENVQVSTINSSQNVKNKRGRKSKKFADAEIGSPVSQSDRSLDVSMNGQSDLNFPSNGLPLDTTNSDLNQSGRGKRQRKPRSTFSLDDLSSSTKRKQNQVFREEKSIKLPEQCPQPRKKRGRPKKTPVTYDEQPSSSAFQINDQLSSNTSLENTLPTPEKEVTLSEIKTSVSIDDEDIDAPLSKRKKNRHSKGNKKQKNIECIENANIEREKSNLTAPEEVTCNDKELTDNDFTEIVEDDLDDLSLSQLKESLEEKSEVPVPEDVPITPDTTEIIQDIKEAVQKNNEILEDIKSYDTTLLEEKPKRARIKSRQYKEVYSSESEEDPYANVELSDDEPKRKRKGRKYYSDDEYVPSKEFSPEQSSDSASDNDVDELDDTIKNRRKNKPLVKSPKKGQKGAKKEDLMSPSVTTILPTTVIEDDDIEGQLQSSVILASDSTPKVIPGKWGNASEFESFLKKKIKGSDLKIKKVNNQSHVVVKALEIPSIDPTQAKKFVETSSQTEQASAKTVGVQTTSKDDLVMKQNVSLTEAQKRKACKFLTSIVKTTSELGQLMTEKSEDFIRKKINTGNVTDTFKMDYCVKKSYLLFKLAKHNLLQMEEDLAKQYEEFLKENNLSSYREPPKVVVAKSKPKTADNDSDCEIVEDKNEKPKFNPKTVFLNKELSIKIAKKPEEKTVKPNIKNIKGLKHTVWISDSVMVKKVKPTQSFLAQDSRTKKPPDSVLLKIVNDFFRDHNRREAVVTCAPFISKEWLTAQHTQICNYFFIKSTDVPPCESERFQLPNTDGLTINPSLVANCYKAQDNKAASSPKSLFTLCTNVLQKTLLFHTFPKNSCDESLINANKFHPKTLFSICTENLQKYLNAVSASEKEPGMDIHENRCNPETLFHSTVDDKQLIKEKENPQTSVNILNTFPVLSLKALCLQNVRGFFETAKATTGDVSLECEGFSAEEDFEDFDSISQCSLENDVETAKNKNTIFESVIKENTAPVLSLKALCLEKLRRIFRNTESKLTLSLDGNAELSLVDDYDLQASESEFDLEMEMNKSTGVKSLLTLCVEIIQKNQKFKGVTNNNPLVLNRPLSLRQISFETLVNIVYFTSETRDNAFTTPELTPTPLVPERTSTESPVKCVEITCLKTEPSCSNAHLTPDEDFSDDNFYGTEEYEPVYQTYEEEAEKDQAEDEHPETNWVSQVQMQISSVVSEQTESNFVESNHSQTLVEPISHIKVEPTEEITPLIEDSPAVKLEPGLNQMTIIHDSIIPKEETEGTTGAGYDVETFESFVRNNKMMRFAERYSDLEDESYTQSGLRIRRQHEPDYYNENDNNLSLLVPQTSEPFNIDIAKDTLMESSSDDESSVRKSGKKKTDRRPRGRPKKQPNREPTLSKEVVKNIEKGKSQMNTEIVALTRKMKEKIRQEEKKTASSESDLEDVPLSLRSERANKKTSNKIDKLATEEIQCNNIDSTEIDNTDKVHDKFTGFSAVDQCEISTYHKYAKFMYDKILEENSKPGSPTQPATQQHDTPAQPATQQHDTPIVSSDEPVEYLECEPSIPIMEDNENIFEKGNRNPSKNANVRAKTINKGQSSESHNFKMRDGWKCYPIDSNDIKLYSSSYIALEKLPNTFVNTYRHYQSFTKKDQDDLEIDKLTNLHSLKRLSTMKEKSISHVKSREKTAVSSNSGNVSDDSRTLTASLSDEKTLSASELSPSEDEDANIEDEPPPPVPKRDSENNQAKNLLMGDYGSDSDCPLINRKIVKKEPNVNRPHKRPGPKSKTVTVEHPENLMLTADKMMNKELALLHAPVNLDEDDPQVSKGEKPKIKHKSGSRYSRIREYVKNEEDSSSEEEKQWVTTKEKLLKRMVKKPEDTGIEDAKRAKLVSEFIERRSDKPDSRKRVKGKLRSRKKFLERQKQLKILSNELYGDQDTAQIGKRSAAYFKGRRNIRKVIDKKSLARSTVVANMEEFERKTRLIATQNRLRKELGCEEDVNVLVINDELCLEYDFEEKQPVVTVHPFFTKVMKAHQYEGVKFMWDACFESLQMIESGEPGGGCILAHCMGLGKTLQVLALLHTVLTHPRVGMQRVLVCCPLSTVLNWVDEIHKWIGPVTDQIKVFELSKLKKTYERAYQLEDWYNGGGIFIIGYELFRSLSLLDPELDDIRPTIVNKIRTALLDPGPDIIVCDEGHLLKNDCSVLAVAMSRVVTKRRIVLTGTPMQNNLREYYCMVNFVKPNLLGTYSEYSNRFENPIMNGQHRDSREEDIKLMKARTHILHKVLEGCLQRQEASVLYPYLPKKHEYTLFINLTDCQWDLYKHYMDNYSRGQKRQGVLKDFHILQKVWTHPQVLHNFLIKPRNETAENAKPKAEKIEDDLADEDINDPEYVKDVKPAEASLWWMDYLDNGGLLETLESSHKLEAVFRILDESVAVGDKMLIFSTSLYTLDTLEYFLKKINKWSLGKEYYRLDGSVPAEVRQKWCREFNAENNHKTKLFLISTRAGSLGLNLVAANRVIILDTSWNPAHDIQSIFRIYRFGQKKDCYIYRLVALGTMEQKIYERSVTKQAVACRVVDEQQIDRHYNSADLTELYRYDESGSSVAGGVAAGVRDVVLLRVARACAVHAAHEHDSLLRGSGEQGLDELERAAAWSQFQQEHEHKQKQNGISSSLSIHIPKKMESPKPDTIVPDVVKSEPGPSREQPSTASAPTATTKRGRYKKGGPVQKCNIPITVEPTEYDETDAIQNNILIAKITNMLIIQNYHTKVGKKISEVVELVRDIVKNNQLRQISKNMDIIAQTLSTALLAQPPNNARGRPPKKDAQLANNVNNTKDGSKNKQEGNKADLSEPPPTKVTEGDRTRRRAAVAAEKQLVETIKDSIIDIDDSWSGGSDHENPPTPPPPSKKTNEKEKPKTYTIKKTKPKDDNPKVTTEASNEISLLSDDDEPRPQIKNEVDSETARPKVPLHRSLLNNDNFIKIVAHTYLNGNPSLDEDAATLAAKYSTLKALKEIESTGIEMYSGPLYDIAVKVLGIEVLEKLHQQKSPPKETPPKAPVSKPGPLSKKLQVKELSKLREEVQEPIIKEQQKSSNSVKKSYVIKLPPQKLKPAPSTQTLSTAGRSAVAVVPVGMFSRSNSVSEECSGAGESESILPDDDVPSLVAIAPAAPTVRSRPGSKPLLINNVSAAKDPKRPVKRIVKVTRIDPTQQVNPSYKVINLPKPKAPPAAKPESILSDTICLDSDEEQAPAPGAAAPGPGAAPVPISLMAATPAALAAIPGVGAAPRLVPVAPRPAPSSQQIVRMLPPQRGRAGLVSSTLAAPLVPAPLYSDSYQPLLSQYNLISAHEPAPPTYSFVPAISVQAPYSDANAPAFSTHAMKTVNLMPVPPSAVPSHIMPVPTYAPIVPTPAKNPPPLVQRSQSYPTPPAQSTPAPSPQTQPAPPPQFQPAPPPQLQPAPPPQSKPAPPPESKPAPPPQSKSAPPSQAKPAPPSELSKKQTSETVPSTSAAVKKKTICKPGDILRIKENGEVEILNRTVEEIDDEPEPSSANRRSTRLKETTPINKPQQTKPDPPKPSKPEPRKPQVSLLRESQPKESVNKKKRKRIISSSSSSSDDDCRSASPDDNPLSILRDVVHIQAADDPLSLRKPPQNKFADKPKQITPTQTRQQNKTQAKPNVSSEPTRSTKKPVSSLNNESATKKQESKTVAGTSRNILISSSGQTQRLPFPSVDLTGGSAVQVTNVQKVVPSAKKPVAPKTAVEPKKRPITSNAANKKQKTGKLMTLADFDLDDFDDIIELE